MNTALMLCASFLRRGSCPPISYPSHLTSLLRSASLWRPLGGASLLVDGHAFLFWIVDQAFDDDYTQWAGGYQRCVSRVGRLCRVRTGSIDRCMPGL